MSGLVSERTMSAGVSGHGHQPADPLRCVGCGTLASLNAWGWRGYRQIALPTEDQLPQRPFACSICLERELHLPGARAAVTHRDSAGEDGLLESARLDLMADANRVSERAPERDAPSD
jgi:hypothetical protein